MWVLASVGVAGCNKTEALTPAPERTSAKQANVTFEALGDHNPAACPAIEGTFAAQPPATMRVRVVREKGNLVISLQTAPSFDFAESVQVSGGVVKSGLTSTTAKCVDGRVLVLSKSGQSARLDVSYDLTSQGLVRGVKVPRNAPVYTLFVLEK